MDGFKLLRRHLARLSQEASDYLYAAETAEEFQYRKGYWDGHLRTLNLTEVLISMAESTDADWMEKEVAKLIEPFRSMGLPKERTEVEDMQDERLSRVLLRARDQISST